MAQALSPLKVCELQEFQGATRLGATGPAALRGKWHSERVSERVAFCDYNSPIQGVLSEVPGRSSQRASQRPPESSQNLSGLLLFSWRPLIFRQARGLLTSVHPYCIPELIPCAAVMDESIEATSCGFKLPNMRSNPAISSWE